MANALYAKAKEAFLKGLIDLSSVDVRAVLVDAALYTPNLATDEFLSSVAVGARVGTPTSLASKTFTPGSNYVDFDAADTTLATVTGAQSEYVLLYVHTGVDATSRLLYLIDTMTGLPVTPSGGDIVLKWKDGVADRIFRWQG